MCVYVIGSRKTTILEQKIKIVLGYFHVPLTEGYKMHFKA